MCFYQHFVESTRAVDRRIQVGYKQAWDKTRSSPLERVTKACSIKIGIYCGFFVEFVEKTKENKAFEFITNCNSQGNILEGLY